MIKVFKNLFSIVIYMTIIYLLVLKLFFPKSWTCDQAEKYEHNQGIEMKTQIFNFHNNWF